MKIGIDGRLINQTGVGRYIRNLIVNLAQVDETNKYTIFLIKEDFEKFDLPNNRWTKRLLNVRWHSLSEQIIMPIVFIREKLDLIHIPYFTIPIFYPGKIIATMHDLTILHIATGKATTLPPPLYALRRLGYKVILSLGVHKAINIIAVSRATKNEIIKYLKIDSKKIITCYEGVDPIFTITKNYKNVLTFPYFLYVGNAYPHKNLELLLESIAQSKKQSDFIVRHKLKFVFVGNNDYFYTQVKNKASEFGISDDLIFLNKVDDEKLAALYQFAEALLFPSKMEGFGLPAIEALAMGCRVIVSDIPVFRELLGSHATYLPLNVSTWANEIETWPINQKSIKNKIVFPQFSWKEMALKTKEVYENCLSL